mmetsp:Transcript_40831/g.119200  ORF Transcript_40831/g.119200 Transcript_40831/m.119200 type:complete len:245 (-) Transcript_40831:8-742(-)
MLHALGFTSSSWPLFRMPDGRTPRTPRGSDGSVPYTANYTCPTGAVGTVRVPATNTIAVGSERGVTVARMVTPKVRSVARDVFGCDTLGGAELENQPTWLGSCWGSHWEQRLFVSDLMAATTSHSAVYSALTLAALEDSGWYEANYTMAEPLLWGRLQGCSFVSSKCVDNGAALATPTPTFCTTDGARGCTVDHKAVATCNLSPLSVAVPAPFQYFPSDPTKGGTQITADFCPCAHPQSNRNES